MLSNYINIKSRQKEYYSAPPNPQGGGISTSMRPAVGLIRSFVEEAMRKANSPLRACIAPEVGRAGGLNLFFIILVVASIPLTAQTYLPSSLCNDTLTLSGSPYIADSSITINSGCALKVEPGVEIRMGNNSFLIIKGKADFSGSAAQPIHIQAKDTAWGIIYIDNAGSQKSTFNYVTIENATNGVYGNTHNDSAFQQAAISCFNSDVEINHCVFKKNMAGIYCFFCKNILIKNCEFDSTNIGEKIHGEQSDSALIDSSIFYFTSGNGDGIDFDGSKNIRISNNRLFGGDSDGIDIGNSGSIGCDGVIITGNFIYNMGDKGISCGELSININAAHNVIAGCDKGIVSKQGSQVIADHNTLYGNRIGILSTDYLDGFGPGNITVTNCIIAASFDSTWAKYYTSAINFSYSLSDIDLIPGIGNINNDPLFVFPAMDSSGNFYLTSSSPAIDNGDPSFTYDPDGSRTDIGTFFYNKESAISISNKMIDGYKVFPNPVKTPATFFISNEALPVENEIVREPLNISVYDVLGQEAKLSKSSSACEQKLNIKTGSLTPGIYFIKIKNGNQLMGEKKIVVE